MEKKTISRDIREKKEKEESDNETQHMYQNQVNMLQLGYNQQQQGSNNNNTQGGMGGNPVGGFNFYNWHKLRRKYTDSNENENEYE